MGCTPKPSKIPSKWISDFHSLVQPSFADIGSIFTATIPFVAAELRSISMRSWQTWHWKKATKGSFKPSNYGFDPIRPRNVIANSQTEFSRVWAYNPLMEHPQPLGKAARKSQILGLGQGYHPRNSLRLSSKSDGSALIPNNPKNARLLKTLGNL